MGNAIFFILIIFAFLLVIEFIMVGAFQSSNSTKGKTILSILCQVILAVCIIAYLLLAGVSLYIGFDLILAGEMSKGISVLLFAIVIAVCVYVWLIRGWVKHILKTIVGGRKLRLTPPIRLLSEQLHTEYFIQGSFLPSGACSPPHIWRDQRRGHPSRTYCPPPWPGAEWG